MNTELAEASPPIAEASAEARRRVRPADVVRWLGWLIPLALFGWFYDLRLLDITRVFPLLRGDWATYIAAPMFVRDAPWLSFPIGRIPGYMAPVGTWLGQTDSWPALYPVYRVLSLLMPHRPFQLIGWQLLGSILVTFGLVRRYVRTEVLAIADDALRAELVGTAAAVVLVAQPYYLVRAGHPALFQMWVIPWCLIVCSRMLEESRDGQRRVTTAGLLAPLAAGATFSPYLGVMLLPVVCVPVLATARSNPREAVIRLIGAPAVVAGVVLTLGYAGTGSRSTSDGFGLYMADAGLLLDGGGVSRVWPNTAPNLTYEGFGFPGTALLILAVGVAVVAVVGRWRRWPMERRTGLWPLWAGIGISMVYALMPVIRIFDDPLLDLNDQLAPLSDMTASVRANGRFAWPLLWMIGLVTVRYVARQPRRLAYGLLGVAALVQVADFVRPTVPTARDQYGPAMAIVRDAVATGVTRIEFQPPNVWTDCPVHEFGPFESIAQLVVAGAVEGLQVNSGYAARGDDRFLDQICNDQRAAYLAGDLENDVLYVLPLGADPITTELQCRPTDLALTVCRLPSPAGVGS